MDNLKSLRVQVLSADDVPFFHNFETLPKGVHKQRGFYSVGNNIPNLVNRIVNYQPHQGEPARTLAVTTGMDSVFFHKDRFEVALDARGFAPEEIICRVLKRYIEIQARKCVPGSREVSRTMSRKYVLPQLVIPEKSECCLTSSGVLIIRVPWGIY